MKFEYAPGSTPLDADESDGLVPQHITTQQELNAWEQDNILRAESWAFSRNRSELLTEPFVRRLHKKMFEDTWLWAGRYRTSDKNIGDPWYAIPERVVYTCETVLYWLSQETFHLDETAVRLHHMLVNVHPFSNGNGRHTRLMADLLLKGEGRPIFAWGGAPLGSETDLRKKYMDALHKADAGNLKSLIAFARS